MIKCKYEISNDGLTLKAEVDEMMGHASKDLENKRFIKSKVTCDRQQWVIRTIQEVPELAEKALHLQRVKAGRGLGKWEDVLKHLNSSCITSRTGKEKGVLRTKKNLM